MNSQTYEKHKHTCSVNHECRAISLASIRCSIAPMSSVHSGLLGVSDSFARCCGCALSTFEASVYVNKILACACRLRACAYACMLLRRLRRLHRLHLVVCWIYAVGLDEVYIYIYGNYITMCSCR